MPYTTLVAGTTITSAWANASVRDQVVTPFATAAARTSAVTAPVTGMLSYRTDGPVFEGYDGVSWVPAARYHQIAWKTADETITSSTSFQNDDHLLVALAANATYLMRAQLMYSAATAADIKTEFAVPSGTTGELKVGAFGSGVSAAAELANLTDTVIFDGNALDAMALMFGTVTVSSTAGNLQLRWAQFASNGTGSVLRAGSYLEVIRID